MVADGYIYAAQTGEQIDANLGAIANVLKMATKRQNDGKVLYIRRGKIVLEDGNNLFDILKLT